MVIYIHGFGGSGLGVKASLFREYFKNKKISYLAPSLSYVPDLAISTLEEIIFTCKDHENLSLIGSSLGGYYAIYLAEKYSLKAVLINPSTQPIKTLPKFLEDRYATNYYDLSSFEINQNHLNMLKKYYVQKPSNGKFLVLLQKDDDVIDYSIAKDIFKDHEVIVDNGGGHSFSNIEKYFEKIKNFLL